MPFAQGSMDAAVSLAAAAAAPITPLPASSSSRGAWSALIFFVVASTANGSGAHGGSLSGSSLTSNHDS